METEAEWRQVERERRVMRIGGAEWVGDAGRHPVRLLSRDIGHCRLQQLVGGVELLAQECGADGG